MDIIHHISFNLSSAQRFWDDLSEIGIKYQMVKLPGSGGHVITFDIAESDSNWPLVFDLLKIHQGFDIYRGGDIFDTFFSDHEIRNAEWSRLIVTFYQGYPYPKNNWPFKQFSLTNVCNGCGIYEQNAPMQLYSEPNMQKNAFLALNMSGEYFATPDVFAKIEAIGAKGYEIRNVICHNTKSASEKVRQLYAPQLAKVGLIDVEQMRKVTCQACGIIKYYPHKKGKMRIQKETLPLDTDFIGTHEWFGIGLLSWREMLISNRVANLILDEKWQGVQLKVVDVV